MLLPAEIIPKIEAIFRNLPNPPPDKGCLPSADLIPDMARQIFTIAARSPSPPHFQFSSQKQALKEILIVQQKTKELLELIKHMRKPSYDYFKNKFESDYTGLNVKFEFIEPYLSCISSCLDNPESNNFSYIEGRGRRSNKTGLCIATESVLFYRLLTGRNPTISVDKSNKAYGDFFILIDNLFKTLSIKESPEVVARKACNAMRAAGDKVKKVGSNNH